MKVTFIQPPVTDAIPAILPSGVEKNRGSNPPLGILLLAACLERMGGHEVRVIDAHAQPMTPQAVAEKALESSPELVGLSVMTFNWPVSLEIARRIRAAHPEVRIIMGGPHPSIYPEETLRTGVCDAVFRGESEIAFMRWLENLDSPEAWAEIPGVTYLDGQRLIDGGQAPYIESLDELPFPARHLLNPDLYGSVLGVSERVTTLFSSRGCPYRCVFCDRPAMGKSFRFRSAENVVDEMEACLEAGIGEFLIYDDTFTVDRARVEAICRTILQRGLEVCWDVRAHVNTVNYDLLALMRDAGLDRIHFGVESGNREILKKLNKGTSKRLASEAFAAARRAGVKSLAYFMIGNPGETLETIEETVDFAIELRPDFVHFSVLIPFPATRIYDKALEDGRFATDHWREFAANPDPNFLPPALEENLTRQQLDEELKRAYRRFYRRPSYLVQRLRGINNFGEFYRQARMGLQLIGI